MGKRAGSKRRRAGVVLVDDHPIVREGLGQLIERDPRLCVRGMASGPTEALQVIRQTKPDIVITDLYFPDGNGLDLIREMTSRFPNLPVVVLSVRDETIYAERSLRAGARGYVMKDEAGESITEAVHRALEGDIYLSEAMSKELLQKFVQQRHSAPKPPEQSLSNRELQVFELIGNGLGTSDIARKLHLSPKTVETYRSKLKLKLGLQDATELRRKAIGWVQSQRLL